MYVIPDSELSVQGKGELPSPSSDSSQHGDENLLVGMLVNADRVTPSRRLGHRRISQICFWAEGDASLGVRLDRLFPGSWLVSGAGSWSDGGDEVEWWVQLVEEGPGLGAMTELFGDGGVVLEDAGMVLEPQRPEFAVVAEAFPLSFEQLDLGTHSAGAEASGNLARLVDGPVQIGKLLGVVFGQWPAADEIFEFVSPFDELAVRGGLDSKSLVMGRRFDHRWESWRTNESIRSSVSGSPRTWMHSLNEPGAPLIQMWVSPLARERAV